MTQSVWLRPGADFRSTTPDSWRRKSDEPPSDARFAVLTTFLALKSDGTMREALVHGRRPGSVPTYGQELLELLRIAVVAGVSVGLLVIGLGSRLAMFVLRVTSPGYVVGMESDDGFESGGSRYRAVTSSSRGALRSG